MPALAPAQTTSGGNQYGAIAGVVLDGGTAGRTPGTPGAGSDNGPGSDNFDGGSEGNDSALASPGLLPFTGRDALLAMALGIVISGLGLALRRYGRRASAIP